MPNADQESKKTSLFFLKTRNQFLFCTSVLSILKLIIFFYWNNFIPILVTLTMHKIPFPRFVFQKLSTIFFFHIQILPCFSFCPFWNNQPHFRTRLLPFPSTKMHLHPSYLFWLKTYNLLSLHIETFIISSCHKVTNMRILNT